MNDTIYEFQIEVFRQLEAAFTKFNITQFAPEDVIVHCNIKGKCAGQAGWKATSDGAEYYLRFNEQAIMEHYDEQIQSTVPHEIAHLICFLRPELGKHHNAGWRRVAIALGDVNAGDRTHSMNLTAAKAKSEYEYKVNGTIVKLGAKRHSKTQKGTAVYTHRVYGKILPSMFVRKIVIRPDNTITHSEHVAKPAPKVPRSSSTIGGPSKVEQAMAIYKTLTFRGEGRGQIIEAFMTELNMSKAGASTYYYNTKNKMS